MLIYEYSVISASEPGFPIPEELGRHIEKYSAARRISSLCAWKLLYDLLEKNGIEYGKLLFGLNGKPFFEGDPCFFSISHSRELCAAAVSDVPVGIDIDYRRKSCSRRMIERSLSKREAAEFDGDFTKIWCRKESIAKLSGEGIIGYPNKIDTLDPGYDFTEERTEYNGEEYYIAVCRRK